MLPLFIVPPLMGGLLAALDDFMAVDVVVDEVIAVLVEEDMVEDMDAVMMMVDTSHLKFIRR